MYINIVCRKVCINPSIVNSSLIIGVLINGKTGNAYHAVVTMPINCVIYIVYHLDLCFMLISRCYNTFTGCMMLKEYPKSRGDGLILACVCI